LVLDKDLVNENEYKVIVLKIEDIYWQNIKYWVDSEAIFYYYYTEETPKEVEVEPETDLNSASEVEENNDIEEIVPLEEQEVKSSIWGTNLNSWDVENQVTVVAKDNTKLPTTWPEHILLLILAIIIWGLVFVYNYRKA
jgi:hypothetical protein